MFSIVLIVSAIAFVLLFRPITAQADWRESMLSAAIVWGFLLAVITELLSYFSLLGRTPVLVSWAVCVLLTISYLISNLNKQFNYNLPLARPKLQPFSFFLLAGIATLCFVVGVIAWISPPNNWDSMTYHMSRVVHWIQNRNVQNYPTNIPRQLYQNPWAEFAILHLKLLSGDDRLANFVQWFAMIGSTIGVSLVAKQLGASARGQIVTAVMCVTLPMGILQGSSTQNDYVVAFWLVCFVYFGLQLRNNGVPLYALATGTSLGLAILTKGSAYIFAFPFMVWLSLSLFKARERLALILILFILLPAIFINFGHYLRNYELYQNPLGPGQEGEVFKFSNDIFSMRSVSSNTIRNLALHLGTPFYGVNKRLESGIYKIHQGLGISPNDARTTWAGTEFHIIPTSLFEDSAGNLLHLALVFASALMLFLYCRKHSEIMIYFACLAGAFLLFSFYLKWQPWHSRLHLPIFVLWTPLIGFVLDRLSWGWVANLITLVSLIGSVPFLIANQARPLLGTDNIINASKEEMYFRNRPLVAEPHRHAVQHILSSQCSNIGLILSGNEWEYPFWVFLTDNKGRPWRIEHVNVTNVSSLKNNEPQFKNFLPCAVIVENDNLADELTIGNNTFKRVWQESPVSIFMKDGL